MAEEISNLLSDTRVKQSLFYILILIIGAFILYVNVNMPLVGEDYTLQPWGSNSAPSSFIEKLNTISNKVYYSAVMWSPRVGEALSTITSVFPKIVFDVINAVLFIWLIIVLFALVNGRCPSSYWYSDGLALFIIVFLIINFFPLLGQVFFWKAGATNHLWGVILILSFSLPFRLNYAKKIEIKHIHSLFLYVLLGFFSGLTVENAGAVTLGTLVIYYVISYRNKTIDRKFIFPLLANAVGVSLLLFSPGTTIRRDYYRQLGYDGNLSGLDMYLDRFIRVHTDFINITWPVLVFFFIILLIYLFVRLRQNQTIERGSINNRRKIIVLIVMFLMAYFSVLVMITISYQSDQRRGFAFFWLIVICLTAYLMAEILKKLPIIWNLLIFAILTIILIPQMFKIGTVYTQFNHEDNVRMEIVMSALNTGQKEVVLPAITIPDSRVLETREILSDLGVRMATYYGFAKVDIQK